MKKICFLIVLCASTMILSAQDYDHHRDRDRNQPPGVVIKSYHKEFKGYGNPTWDMQNNEWHTKYMDKGNGNRNVDVYYDTYGRRIQTGREWDPVRLPAPVRDRISRKYHEENYSAYRIERPGKRPFFQVTLAANRKMIYIDERGREVRYY
ncbi:MAG: hypothetical protein E6H10_02210 [Bacteroidetes bacterium]|nr:MAG: hypothetical protein E6H10_02210 [Bacteroidota bacterium]